MPHDSRASKVDQCFLVPKPKWKGACFTLFLLLEEDSIPISLEQVNQSQHGNLKTANKKILGVTFESKEQCMQTVFKNIFTAKPNNGFHGLGFCCVSDSINV